MDEISWPSLARHWKDRFGETVRRISLDAGFDCPNQPEGGCLYCDPGSFSPSAGDARPVSVQLRVGIERLGARGIKRFAAYFQPRTNTNAPLEKLKEVWDAAAAEPQVVVLCVGTRPDCLGNGVLDLLAGYGRRFGEIWLELGLQSSHDRTLLYLNRRHDAASFMDGVLRAKERGIKVCAHVILGLPGEDGEMELATADFLRRAGVEGVKLHQLAVIPGTRLLAEYNLGKVRMLTEDEYVARAAFFVTRLERSTVIHRLVGETLGGAEIAPNFDKNRVLASIRKRLL